ncbi:MAG: hypothetical protein ACYDGR_14330 [Candidatus Dormibacteria bacterium]
MTSDPLTTRSDPDGLARAVLLRVLPTGYRLVDPGDVRFGEVRAPFLRLALRHLGPRPSLLGFCEVGVDVESAARGLAAWASTNFVPNAIQKRLSPSVVVIAIDPPPSIRPGLIAGAAVPTAIWTVAADGSVQAASRPPGAPAPGLVRRAAAELTRGAEPPTIGQLDVAERTVMAGSVGRGYADTGGLYLLLGVGAVLFALRTLGTLLIYLRAPGLPALAQGIVLAAAALTAALAFNLGDVRSSLVGFNSRNPVVAAACFLALWVSAGAASAMVNNLASPPTTGDVVGRCRAPLCRVVQAGDASGSVDLTVGETLVVALGPSDGNGPAPGCAAVVDARVLTFITCAERGQAGGDLYTQFTAAEPGTTVVRVGDTYSLTVTVR